MPQAASGRPPAPLAAVELYWLPLGAGGAACVRRSGRLFETAAARRQHRRACDLYHSALIVRLGGGYYTVEMTPAWGAAEPGRGVVGEGPVGLRWLGRPGAAPLAGPPGSPSPQGRRMTGRPGRG
jgi:hypothetical protein